MKIAVIYMLGALVAIVVNLALQEVVHQLQLAPDWGLLPSVLAGTAGGLVFKYVWDKFLIFGYRAGSKGRDARTFLAYSLTGIATTAIFWGFEFGFDALFGTKPMRYVGAIIGLSIGYLVKYHLDRQFVFTAKPG